MIRINAGIRTCFGIARRSSEIITLLAISTKVTAKPIPMPFIAAVVKAKVGQVPSTSFKVGLEDITPSFAIFLKFVFIIFRPPDILLRS